MCATEGTHTTGKLNATTPGGPEKLKVDYEDNRRAATPRPVATEFCPSAQTLLGRNSTTKQVRLIPIRCKRWTCDFCRWRNLANLRARANLGRPTTFITLTSPRWAGETPKQCHDRMRPKLAQLVTKIRRHFGNFEAAIFLEETKTGFPHWHLLARCTWIPQKWLSKEWHKLTGAYIVDIRAIDQTTDAVAYVCKYVTKTTRKPQAERLGRAVSYTKGYARLPRAERDKAWFWALLKHTEWTDLRARLQREYEEAVAADGFLYTPRTLATPTSLDLISVPGQSPQVPATDRSAANWCDTS